MGSLSDHSKPLLQDRTSASSWYKCRYSDTPVILGKASGQVITQGKNSLLHALKHIVVS